MKRAHRLWHRRMGAVLLPTLLALLLWAGWARSLPASPADVPPEIVNTPVAAN